MKDEQAEKVEVRQALELLQEVEWEESQQRVLRGFDVIILQERRMRKSSSGKFFRKGTYSVSELRVVLSIVGFDSALVLCGEV